MVILFPKKKRAAPFRAALAKTGSGKRPEICIRHQSDAEQKEQKIKNEIPPFEICRAYIAAHQPNEHEKTKGKAEKTESRAYEHKSSRFCQKNTPETRKVKKQKNSGGETAVVRQLVEVSEIEFKTEVAAVAPTEIRLEVAVLIRDERQPTESASAKRNIPPSVRIKHSLWVTPDSFRFFVGIADNIKGEVVAKVAKSPVKFPAFFSCSVFFRWVQSVNISKPPNEIELLAHCDFLV